MSQRINNSELNQNIQIAEQSVNNSAINTILPIANNLPFYSSNFINNINGNTNLLDLDFNNLGALIGLANSIQYLPHPQIKKN